MGGPLELWVGVEATVNRVGDTYLDQLELSGVDRRLDDLDRLASLGARRVRFPLLWERTAPQGLEAADWSWTDARLERLGQLGLAPIAGLVHHGSGPRHTSLLDPGFATGLAGYARAVAERYPHLDAYTPVNEPLTTARFSALYGVWYPHARDARSWWQALSNQLRATVLAMRAVRQVNPAAQLIQTEDLGRTYSTPALRYQADFENERRWLSLDLLHGRVDQQHPLWGFLRWLGALEADVLWFAEHPCPPQVTGLNVYATGERHLDEKLGRYPAHTHGGNGRHRYADVEAVRVRGALPGDFAERLLEAHARYGGALAITEAHLGCTREEQLRWLNGAWEGALAARAAGADVRAVTPWAAFGAFEWNSLLTRQAGHYEPGLWDVRPGGGADAPPRETALASLARDLAAGRAPGHPTLAGPGWWRRAERLLYPVVGRLEAVPAAGRPVILDGPAGPLRAAFARACDLRGLPHASPEAGKVSATVERLRPWAWVHLGAEVDAALLEACAEQGVALACVGAGAGWPATVLDLQIGELMLPDEGFVAQAWRALETGEPLDWPTHPLHLSLPHDVAYTALDLLIDGETGRWSLIHPGPTDPAEVARLLAQVARVDAEPVVERVTLMPHLSHGLHRFVREQRHAAERAAAQVAAPAPR